MSLFPHTVNIEPATAPWWILADAQWEDSFQLLEGRVPMRLANRKVDFIIRPEFDHPTLIKYLSSVQAEQSEGCVINIDDAERGFVTIIVPQPIVARDIPPTGGRPWKYMLRVLDRGPDFSWRPQEVVRGDFYCHAGRTS